ncbi:exporter of polyketide antibiotics [Glycomyces endophyticus]|uniref:Exporter of polyketide antibiotics n=1 Tax=Glycomyces endophyticus TaxID=480996 RepID=A0ABP4SWK7_9ACTN
MATAAAEIENGLGTLAGTGKMLRFQLRRTRMFLFWWIAGIAGFTWMVVPVLADQYPTEAERAGFAATMSSPAMLSMSGPVEYVHAYAASVGALFSHRMILWTCAMTAVMFVLLVTRLTRADEETSRSEVIRSLPIGRRADLAAALLVGTGAAVVLGGLLALAASGLDGGDARSPVLFGAAHTAVGLVFAGLTAVAAQLSENASTSTGYGLAALGASVLFAGAGNAEGTWATWLSPIGWSQLTYVYTPEERWWPLLVSGAVAAGAVWLAFALVAHRDFGQGMFAARRGRAEAKAGLKSATALTFRLVRGLIWTGVVTTLLLGLAYGSVLGGADDFADGLSDAQQAILDRGGADLRLSFATTFISINAIVAALFGVLVVGRARREETVGRGELIAAGPVARSGWPGSYLPAALFTATLTNLVAGLGLAAGGSGGDGDLFGKITVGTLVQLPAIWVVIAFVFAAFAWLPRLGWLRWLAWTWTLLVVYFGALLNLPEWAMAISPFDHLGNYPAEDFSTPALAVLTAVAALLAALGYLGLRRRSLSFN